MHMFVLGLLCHLYSLDATLAREQIARLFGNTDTQVIQSNIALCEAGAAWAEAKLPLQIRIPATPPSEPQIVIDGPTAIALGVMASGMDICTLAPNTLDAAAAQAFSEMFEKIGGLVHPAEDQIAACAFALGASYAGKCAVSLTSGAGYALQQPLIDLAVKAEVPLVVIQLQGHGSGGSQAPADEPGGLLAAVFGSQGDAPKVVMAASGIEDGFYAVIAARKIAETFGMVVVLLCDAGLAHAQQAIPRPQSSADWLAPPVDQTPVPAGLKPCDWDPVTGLSRRLQPGRAGGMHTITGLAHGRDGQATRDPGVAEECRRARSLKLAALQQSLKTPTVFGAPSGDMLLIGWGSSQGATEEAVTRLRAEGLAVSALHLRFIQPLPPGMHDILARFARVMTIEADGSAKPEDGRLAADQRRHSALALMLRARFLRDIGCWSEARGTPIRPADICRVVRAALLNKDPAP
jgi:2-oxoglutarate ferredoxin oxidoreductase subunit alpha